MNMHATVELQTTQDDLVRSIGELLTAALRLIDELDMPADVGAHLDLTIQRLSNVRMGPAAGISAPALD